MLKLNLQSTPGFNGGKSYFSKPMLITEIKIDPEISGIFKISDEIRDEIKQRIEKFGYDKSQPVVVQKGTNILLDGHTRLDAAKRAGLAEVPTVEMEFENRDDAILYTFERQAIRRSLTGAEVLKAAEMIPEERNGRGEGRRAVLLAKRLCVSPSTVYQAIDILKNSSEEDLQAVRNGDISIKKAYKKNHSQKPDKISEPDVEFTVTDAQGFPENVKFLKGAAILLVDANQTLSADLLIKHYLQKNQINGFYSLLPETIKDTLMNYNSLESFKAFNTSSAIPNS